MRAPELSNAAAAAAQTKSRALPHRRYTYIYIAKQRLQVDEGGEREKEYRTDPLIFADQNGRAKNDYPLFAAASAALEELIASRTRAEA